MSDRILITSVEVVGDIVDIGKEVAASLPSHRRYRYSQNVKYTLENGATVHFSEHGLTKPKLKEAIERTRRYIQDKEYFKTPGGFCTVFNIGPKRVGA